MSVIQVYQAQLTGSVESKDWQELIANIKKADGLHSVSWALQEEDSKIAGIIANFKSLDAQKKWASSTQHDSTAKQLKSLSTGDIYADTVIMADDAEASLEAKTVELVSWIYPTKKVDSDFEKKCAEGFIKFGDSISASKWASGGMVAGWSTNTFKHEGEESRRFTGLIGWQSVEAHYECKKTPTFTDYIHWLDNGDTGVEMVHYAYSKHKNDSNGSLL